MSNVKINIIVDGTNTGQIDTVNGKLKELGSTAAAAGEKTSMSLTDMKSGFDILSTAVRTSVGMLDDVNKLGTAFIRAGDALNSLSGGKADEYLSAMRTSTHGLVSDMDLAHQATKALGLGIVQTAEDAAKLGKYGAILGQNFLGNAGQGVETLTNAIQRVGLVQLLDNIGLSGERVKNRFQILKETMSDSDAWRLAVFEDAERNVGKLESSLDGAGSAAERLGTRFENFKSKMAGNFTIGLEASINLVDAFLDRAGINLARMQGQVHDLIVPPTEPTPINTWHPPMAPQQWHPPMVTQPQVLPNNGVWGPSAGGGSSKPESWMYQAPAPGIHVGKNDDYMYEVVSHKMGVASDQQMAAANQLRSAADKLQNAADMQRRASGLKGAFDLSQSGTSGEMGGALQQGLAERRSTLQKQGFSKDQLALVDQQNKMATDAYALATGAATLESLKFDEVTANLVKSMGKGKISALDGAKAINELRLAAEGGYASMSNLDIMSRKFGNAWSPTFDSKGHVDVKKSGINFEAMGEGRIPTGLQNVDVNDKTGHTTPDDPFKFYEASAKKAQGQIDSVRNHFGSSVGQMLAAGAKMGNTFAPFIGSASKAASSTGAIVSMIHRIPAQVKSHISVTVDVNGKPTMP